MHRFYLTASETKGQVLELIGREAHHALHVLRLRCGDPAVVMDGHGQQIRCQVAGSAKDRLELEVLERKALPVSPFQVTLAQAVPKGKLFEDIIEKAVELGASRIVPLITERTVGKFEEEDRARKVEKWQLVAIEALKQCGAGWLPRIEMLSTVDQFASQQTAIELSLVGSLTGEAKHPKLYFEAFTSERGRRPRSVSIAIGPEGDFTTNELSALQAAGARPITMGPLVLRTETAAIYALSVINYELRATPKDLNVG